METTERHCRSADAELAVNVQSVTKQFGSGETRVLAIRGTDFRVRCGELTLLVGPSGCGKTTMLSIIAGLLSPTEGSVQVFGRSLLEMSGREKIRFRGESIGFVFQHHHLLPALTAAENTAVPLMILRRSRSEALDAARRALERVHLEHRADALPETLSGGEQQRAALARAMVHEPRLMVCDEPTASLDADTGRQVMQLLRDVAVQRDRAVVAVTHDQRMFEFGDCIARMDDGRIESVDTPAGSNMDAGQSAEGPESS